MFDYIVALLVILIIAAAYLYEKDDNPRRAADAAAKEAEKRCQLAEAISEQLAVDSRAASRQLGGEKKAVSQDEDDASFVNLGFPNNETAH